MKRDQIFTPPDIVVKMLDMISYNGANLNKTIWEPSFGNGNFLVEIVNRILDSGHPECLDNVYGCEIDETLYKMTILRLNELLNAKNLQYDWKNLKCCNAFDWPDTKYDFIVGNPPYVRIHDLDEESQKHLQNLKFCGGMCDMYVAFFELGINHLVADGKLIYITPNSYLKNTSQRDFRDYIRQKLRIIVDYNRNLVFDKILTYTCITLLDNAYDGPHTYIRMKDMNTVDYKCETSDFTFVSSDDEEFLASIASSKKLGDICDVRYGIATNADDVYINPPKCEPAVVYPIIKASTLQPQTILYPYEHDTVCVPEILFATHYPVAYDYLCQNRDRLAKRDMDGDGPFYRYARTQGLKDIRHNKFALKHIIPNSATVCEFAELDDKTLVYSGMMLIPHEGEFEKVREILQSAAFCRYLKIYGKDMQGGYKTFNTKVVKSFPVIEQNCLN